MRVSNELKKIEDLYTSNLKSQGTVPTAVGWNSPESQRLRFEKLTTVIEDRSAPVSINDYGCGYGAHLEYAIKHCGVPVAAYHGYDLSESMLAAAKENLGFFEGELDLRRAKDIITTADFSFVSGTFNVRLNRPTRTGRRSSKPSWPRSMRTRRAASPSICCRPMSTGRIPTCPTAIPPTGSTCASESTQSASPFSTITRFMSGPSWCAST